MERKVLTLLLVRHATTEANEAGLYLGRSESPLSLRGREEASRICEKIKEWPIDEVYRSPAERVKETIQSITSYNQSAQVIEALQEIDFGICEMKDYTWLKKHYPEEITRMMTEGMQYQYPEGESLIMAHERVANWLDNFLRSHSTGNFLVVAHGGTIRCILSQLLVKNASLHWHFKIDPATITIIRIEEGFPVIETLNRKY